MDWDEREVVQNEWRFRLWLNRYKKCRGSPLTDWLSSLHPEKLACCLAWDEVKDDHHGSFNIVTKVTFTDGKSWAVRIPMVGFVKRANEKIVAEVATMRLIQQHTSIPVPRILAWGLAADNPLRLGPFMISDYVEGVSLGKVLKRTDEVGGRMMREDMTDDSIRKIFRQIAHFMLELNSLNFDCIGSLNGETRLANDGRSWTAHARPFTFKAHAILDTGGVDLFCDSNSTFASASAFLQYTVKQDLDQLQQQLNSVDDEADARQKYIYWHIMQKLVSRFVTPSTDNGPFKLVCDDFGPANMIVNNAEDLDIIGVVDWEWSYAGPVEFLWSAPRWLLVKTPNTWREKSVLPRFNHYLDMFIEELCAQEGEYVGGDTAPEQIPSTMVRKSRENGSMWLYYIIRDAFNGPDNVPFHLLRTCVSDWDQLVHQVPEEQVEAFVKMKVEHLKAYEQEKKQSEEWVARLLDGREELPSIDEY